MADRTLYAYKLAKQMGIKGKFFRSGKEAKRYLSLLILEEAGKIRNLRTQVDFQLQARRPDGLMENVCAYRADFVYEEFREYAWIEVVEDTKPSGFKVKNGKKVPFREEVYLLKKKWFEAQYGKEIRET